MDLHHQSVEHFAALFRGRTDAYGALHGEAIRRTVTLRRYFLHLQGRDSIGIYPLLDDGTCWWACVDIDHDDIEATRELVSCLHSLGLNRGVYIERSRSKGWHVWVFFDCPVVAADIRRVLGEGLRPAGLPLSTEVFPKRDRLTKDVRLGNYVNLPYFGGDRPDGRRTVADLLTLEPITWQHFVAEAFPFPADALSLVVESLPAPVSLASNGPQPDRLATGWLAELLTSRVEVGFRRPSLVRLAGALRSHGLDEQSAVALAEPWAQSAFVVPLEPAEVEKHIRGVYQRYGVRSLSVLDRRAHAIARQLGARQ